MIVEYDRQPPSRVTQLMYLGEEPWTANFPWKPLVVVGLAYLAFTWLADRY